MRAHDFLLLTLAAMGGKVRGKTQLQKRVYFVGLLTGKLDQLEYHPHYYGPYSELVADTIAELKSTGFVDQDESVYGVDASGFEMCRTDYELTPDGQDTANLLKEQYPKTWQAIEKAWKRFEQSGGKMHYMQLAIAAKVLHILREQDAGGSEAEIQEAATKLGWNVGESDLKEAKQFLAKLSVLPEKSLAV